MTILVAGYVAGLDPAAQSFLAAAFCAGALVCLTSIGLLATHALDQLSNRLVGSGRRPPGRRPER